MYAFWRYDMHFGVLGGKVEGDIHPGGFVCVEGYTGMQFKPIILLPDEEGQQIHKELKALEKERDKAQEAIGATYLKRAEKIAPFLVGLK
jgi:hypothetical protein